MGSTKLGNTEGGIGSMGFEALSAMGGAISAYGTFESGRQQNQAWGYNAENAMIRAQNTREAEVLNQEQMQRKQNQIIGAQRAGYAGVGVRVNTGTPLDMMVDTMYQSKMDMAISKYNSDVNASALESEAAMDRFYGEQTQTASTGKAVGELMVAGGMLALALI